MERNERLALIVQRLGHLANLYGVPSASIPDLAARMVDASEGEAMHIFKNEEFRDAFVDLSFFQLMNSASCQHLFQSASTAATTEAEPEVSEAERERRKLKDWLESKEGQSAPPEQRLRACNIIAAGEAKQEKSGADQAFERHLQKIIKSVPSFSEWSPERKNELASVTRHEWDAARKQQKVTAE